jgi:hypothetical protein
MKKYLFHAILLFVLVSCSNYGKEKIYDGTELYHTDKVTDAESDALGKYLVDNKFADGKTKTVQLTKSDNTYQFRMVVKEGIDKDTAYAKTAKFLATMLSAQVFNGSPVEVQLCDDQLATLKTLTSDDFGKMKNFDGVGLFHSKNITDAEFNAMGNYLVSSKFADGRAKNAEITKSGNIYQFKFVVKKGIDKDPSYLENGKAFASQLSSGVFNGAPVEVLMCDDYFNTLVVLPMTDTTKKM